MHRLGLLLRLPRRQQRLLLEAACWLLLARPLVGLHVRHWPRLLGAAQAETPPDLDPPQRRAAQEVTWSLRNVSPHVGWRADCLPQAFAAVFMLRRRGVPTTLYLGAQLTPDRAALRGHAWVRAGEMIVTGAPGHHGYGVVSAFATKR